MTDLQDLPLRDDLRGQTPYGAPQLDVPVALNVNENSYSVPPDVVSAMSDAIAKVLPDLNRYPDRDFTALRGKLVGYLNRVLLTQGAADRNPVLTPDWIWAANGSNEVLSHILQAFGGPGRTAMGFTPSYSMHPLITTGTGASFLSVPRAADFHIDVDAALAAIEGARPDVVFVCTPNNPTGGSTPIESVERIVRAAPGIVIVDEAYAEFARPGFVSALTLLDEYPRLVVSRTMSKAFAFAGVRLGYAVAQPALIDALKLVRLPYHLSALTLAAAGAALDHADSLLANVEALKTSRDRMRDALLGLGFSVADSDSNFLLFGSIADPHGLWQYLLDRGVLVRDNGIPGHLRVNAGTEAETDAFIAAVTAVVSAHPELLTAPSETQD